MKTRSPTDLAARKPAAGAWKSIRPLFAVVYAPILQAGACRLVINYKQMIFHGLVLPSLLPDVPAVVFTAADMVFTDICFPAEHKRWPATDGAAELLADLAGQHISPYLLNRFPNSHIVVVVHGTSWVFYFNVDRLIYECLSHVYISSLLVGLVVMPLVGVI